MRIHLRDREIKAHTCYPESDVTYEASYGSNIATDIDNYKWFLDQKGAATV